MLLPKFEEAILGKEIGGGRLVHPSSLKDGYGEVIADAIVDLPKKIYSWSICKLARRHPLRGFAGADERQPGNRMMGIVKEVGDEKP